MRAGYYPREAAPLVSQALVRAIRIRRGHRAGCGQILGLVIDELTEMLVAEYGLLAEGMLRDARLFTSSDVARVGGFKPSEALQAGVHRYPPRAARNLWRWQTRHGCRSEAEANALMMAMLGISTENLKKPMQEV